MDKTIINGKRTTSKNSNKAKNQKKKVKKTPIKMYSEKKAKPPVYDDDYEFYDGGYKEEAVSNGKGIVLGENLKRDIAGVGILLFGLLCLMGVFFDGIAGSFGLAMKSILMGMFGLSAFTIPFGLIVIAFLLFFDRTKEISLFRLVGIFFLVIFVSAIFTAGYYVPDNYINMNAGEKLIKIYQDGTAGYGGGAVGGILAIPLAYIFGMTGTVLIIAFLALLDIMLITEYSFIEIFKSIFYVFGQIGMYIVRFCRFLYNKIKYSAKVLAESFGEEEKYIEGEFEDYEEDDEYEKEDMLFSENLKDKKETYMEENVKKLDADVKIYKKDKSNVNPVSDENVTKEVSEINFIMKKPSSEKLSDKKAPQSKDTDYIPPSFNFLRAPKEDETDMQMLKAQAIEGARKLEDTFRTFNITVKVNNIARGPAVTRYELAPAAGVKVSSITKLSDDISLALAAPGVRMEAPIPGKSAIGIEIPNKKVSSVYLSEILKSERFLNHPSDLATGLGKDITGDAIIADLSKMPHLLIAGATGSGKSVCINSLIISLLYKSSPKDVKLIMVDPKVVELAVYNGIPHLLIPVVTDPKKASGALNWAVIEMERRYKLFAERGVRELGGYNANLIKNNEEELLPKIVIIIDELADLMMSAPKEVEDSICRLAQKARAAGMYLVLATQRPSVDVITGIIKANIPSRIAFAVSSQIDSRTILDTAGAEKLLGKGDMLFHPVGEPKPLRVKGAFVSDDELEEIVGFIKKQCNSNYDIDVLDKIESAGGNNDDDFEAEVDELLEKAVELAIDSGQVSTSMVQRRFKVGYARAGRIVDQMEQMRIVGPQEGSKPRQMLVTRAQWNEIKINLK